MRTEDVLDQIDGALGDWEVGPDAMRCGAPPEPRPSTAPGIVMQRIVIDLTPFVQEMARAAECLARIGATINAQFPPGALARLAAALHPPSTTSAPTPLCIDGHAYARRRRSRGRR